MSLVEKTVLLRTSPEALFAYIADVRNHPAFIEALKSVDHISGDPKQQGATWEWEFEMAGVLLRGESETVECRQDALFSFRTVSGIRSLFTYDMELDGSNTKLKIRVEYDPPDSLLAKALDRSFIERMNDAEGEAAIRNLSTIFNTD